MSIEKKPFELDFQRESQKIFKNNVNEYNTNDISFLRRLNNLYGDALNAKGLNVADPFEANMFHYNKLGFKGNIDHPRVTKTYVFFTRPELNFSFENISSVPFFKWLYAQDIGKMIMASLTDPEYFINAPTAFNAANFNGKEFESILSNFRDAMKDAEKMNNLDNKLIYCNLPMRKISPYIEKDSLDIINNISVKEYNLIADEEKKNTIGCIAQELREVLPDNLQSIVKGVEEKETLAIDNDKLIYILIKAVQELSKEIEELKK